VFKGEDRPMTATPHIGFCSAQSVFPGTTVRGQLVPGPSTITKRVPDRPHDSTAEPWAALLSWVPCSPTNFLGWRPVSRSCSNGIHGSPVRRRGGFVAGSLIHACCGPKLALVWEILRLTVPASSCSTVDHAGSPRYSRTSIPSRNADLGASPFFDTLSE